MSRWPNTRLATELGIELPIVHAPMVGACTTEVVIAVSEAGGLGSFGAGASSPDRIRELVAEIRGATRRAFNINLFLYEPPSISPEAIEEASARLSHYRAELGLPPTAPPGALGGLRPQAPAVSAPSIDDQIEALIGAAPPVASFTFGVLDLDRVERFHRAGSKVIGTATNVEEARAWEAAGADAVCAQGSEAGGHRGTFIGPFERSLIGTMALVPQIADAVKVPVIAAGGIMDGRGIAAAIVLGASGAQLGTAFLCCPESGVAPGWIEAVAGAPAHGTVVTRVFSGRPARGVANRFVEELRPIEAELPPYPIQNALTTELRRAATAAQRFDLVSLWSGQGGSMSRPMAAAELVALLDRETRQILAPSGASA